MGMTKASLDFQIQQETQKSIVILQRNIKQLDEILQIVDSNMRQSYMAMLRDITSLTVRVNFLMSELKIGMTDAGLAGLEERFKTFAENEKEKMQKEVAEVIKEKEEEVAKAVAAEEIKKNVVQ